MDSGFYLCFAPTRFPGFQLLYYVFGSSIISLRLSPYILFCGSRLGHRWMIRDVYPNKAIEEMIFVKDHLIGTTLTIQFNKITIIIITNISNIGGWSFLSDRRVKVASSSMIFNKNDLLLTKWTSWSYLWTQHESVAPGGRIR